MSQEAYERLLPQMKALPKEEVRRPAIPPDEALKEGVYLLEHIGPDVGKLTAAGMDPGLLDELRDQIGALSYAQTLWNATFVDKEEARLAWAKLEPELLDDRAIMLHDLYFALRKDPDALAFVKRIDEGTSNADLLQDQSDLGHAGVKYATQLQAIGADMSRFERAGEQASQVGELMAAASGETQLPREAKDMRDRAFTLLWRTLGEIRETGRYVFWRDEDRVKLYASAYRRRKRLEQEGEGDAEAEAPPAE